jgi:hypothetical protein
MVGLKKTNTSKLISGTYIFFCLLKIQRRDIRNPTKKRVALIKNRKSSLQCNSRLEIILDQGAIIQNV